MKPLDLPAQVKMTQTRKAATSCPGCASHNLECFYEIADVPANSCLLFDTVEEALDCPKSNIALTLCGDCGFVFNAAFDQAQLEYSGRYEETQGFSPTFSRFHRDLAQRMIESHDLRGREVMEIGCGKGEFLLLLAQLGDNRGIGVDPSALQERLKGHEGADKVTLIPEYFRPDHCKSEPDFLCCKMTLEHISETHSFISVIREGLSVERGTLVFFQVPSAERIWDECSFEDIYHEHCSYFSEASLRDLFESCGFRVTSSAREYDDQYLTIEAVAQGLSRPASGAGAAESARQIASFTSRVGEVQARWRDLVLEAHGAGKKVALWGSGSKAVAFLTTLGLGDAVECVTDINPNRHGYFMPGTGHKIVDPTKLAEIRPDVVIAMNRIYQDEINSDLKKLGLDCELHCL